jgi:hypothetical protein
MKTSGMTRALYDCPATHLTPTGRCRCSSWWPPSRHPLAQWVWNLRLELGQALSPSELRTTEFAPARTVELVHACEPAVGAARSQVNACGNVWTSEVRPSILYAWLSRLCLCTPTGWDAAVSRQPPPLSAIRSVPSTMAPMLAVVCRSCPLRPQCLISSTTLKPQRVSAVL